MHELVLLFIFIGPTVVSINVNRHNRKTSKQVTSRLRMFLINGESSQGYEIEIFITCISFEMKILL